MTHIGIFHDGATGETVERTLTDDEVAATFLPQLVFSASETSVPSNGETTITIYVQLSTVPLSDDTRRPIKEARSVQYLQEGEVDTVELDENGYAEFEVAFAAAGDYDFEPYQMGGVAVKVIAK